MSVNFCRYASWFQYPHRQESFNLCYVSMLLDPSQSHNLLGRTYHHPCDWYRFVTGCFCVMSMLFKALS